MTRYFSFSILICLILLLGSCRHEDRLPIYRWTPAGQDFDSVTMAFERDFNDILPPEILRHHLNALDSITDLTVNDPKLLSIRRARTHFFKGRYAHRFSEKDSALYHTHTALDLSDSATLTYDWLRIRTQMFDIDNNSNGAEQYNHLLLALQYAREVGDLPYEGQLNGTLGNLMDAIGLYEEALRYQSAADSLYTLAGLRKIPVRNTINRARILGHMGYREKVDSMILSLKGNSALQQDTFAQNLISRNIYAQHTDEVNYLYDAYNQIKTIPRFRYLKGFYQALLTAHYIENLNLDSMIFYADAMMEELPYVKDHDHRAMIWYNRSRVWAYLNQPDSALRARIRFEESVDSMWYHRQKNEVTRLHALEEMRRQEAEYELANTRRNWLTALLAVGFFGSAGVIFLLLNRRHIRQRLHNMANELELEKAKRKMAATALTLEEKNVMLDTLRSELSEMRKDGEIREGSARRLESAIKTHLSEHEQEEKFHEMFDIVNPGFVDRLRHLCPDIADSYVKLACYTLMELDNKKIGALMMIKPESVRQARWRLRSRLHIPENVSLEDFLRNLNIPQ